MQKIFTVYMLYMELTIGLSLYRLGSDLTENTFVAQEWIYANYIENTASTVIVFTAPSTELDTTVHAVPGTVTVRSFLQYEP
jgi:hypothetical protein